MNSSLKDMLLLLLLSDLPYTNVKYFVHIAFILHPFVSF